MRKRRQIGRVFSFDFTYKSQPLDSYPVLCQSYPARISNPVYLTHLTSCPEKPYPFSANLALTHLPDPEIIFALFPRFPFLPAILHAVPLVHALSHSQGPVTLLSAHHTFAQNYDLAQLDHTGGIVMLVLRMMNFIGIVAQKER